jgi:hypothetical protein
MKESTDEKMKQKATIIQHNIERDEFKIGGEGFELSEEYLQLTKEIIREAHGKYPFDPDDAIKNPENWNPVDQADYFVEIHGRGDDMRVVSNSGSSAFDAWMIACAAELVDVEPDGMEINGVRVADA